MLNSQTVAAGRPKAYLNWLLLDEQYRYAGGGFEQVGENEAFKTHVKTGLEVTRNGYLYIYVSNETPNVDVFFDNLQVTHVRGPLLEETHYYPFGLTMAGISSKAAGKLENRYKYNKNELQNKEFSDGSGLEWYDFNARTFDQQVGRFMQIDPIPDEGDQEDLTPYHFSGNNPSTFNDPNGKCPWCIGAIVGAAVDAGLQLAEVALTDKKLNEFSFKSVFVSAAAGAVGVGIATKIEKAVKVAEIASTGVKTAIKIGANAATDAATSAASQKLKNGKVDGGEVLIDVVAGGVAGKIAGNIAEKAARNSSAGKTLAKQANRAERVAANSTRAARQEAAKQANEKVEDHIATRGAAAGTASSNAASEAVKKVVKKEDDKQKQ